MKHTLTIKEGQIPILGLGTYGLNGRKCTDIVSGAIQLGYRHLDTAQMYRNESEVGEGIRNSGTPRGEVFLTTKVSTGNMDPSSIRSSTEKSLEKLGTDYVDLLLIHWPTSGMDLESCLGAMFDLRNQGKLRHVGVSNFDSGLFRQAMDLGPVVCNQVEFSPYVNQSENLTTAKYGGAIITAYSPLARGRVGRDDLLVEIGKEYQKTAAQVALRWLVQQESVSVIPKSGGETHLRENMEIFDFDLSDEDMEKISALNR